MHIRYVAFSKPSMNDNDIVFQIYHLLSFHSLSLASLIITEYLLLYFSSPQHWDFLCSI